MYINSRRAAITPNGQIRQGRTTGSRSGMLTLEDAWRNHAYGSKHRHFRYPSTWRGRVNPGRLGGACGRRSGFQCRGCLRAEHSRLRLTQFGVRGSACCRFGESATGRSDKCHQSRNACRESGGSCCPNGSGHKPQPSEQLQTYFFTIVPLAM